VFVQAKLEQPDAVRAGSPSGWSLARSRSGPPAAGPPQRADGQNAGKLDPTARASHGPFQVISMHRVLGDIAMSRMVAWWCAENGSLSQGRGCSGLAKSARMPSARQFVGEKTVSRPIDDAEGLRVWKMPATMQAGVGVGPPGRNGSRRRPAPQ
jgi:hypothetical protein